MSLELLSLGVDMLGGIFGRKRDKENLAFQRKQLQLAEDQFNRQMNESVQSRVKDAQKAGVHPLFALGASVGSSPTLSAGAPQTGNSMGNALENMARTLGVIEQNRASARKDEAEAALFDSERKRLEQEMASRGRDMPGIQSAGQVKTFPYPEPGPSAVYGPAEYINPQVHTSQRLGVESGTHPGELQYVDQKGRKWTIPAPSMNMDEIGQVKYVANALIGKGMDARIAWEIAKQDAAQKRRKQNRKRINSDDAWISP